MNLKEQLKEALDKVEELKEELCALRGLMAPSDIIREKARDCERAEIILSKAKILSDNDTVVDAVLLLLEQRDRIKEIIGKAQYINCTPQCNGWPAHSPCDCGAWEYNDVINSLIRCL